MNQSIMLRVRIGEQWQNKAYTLLPDNEIDAPCGCHACDNAVQPGHFACGMPDEGLLSLEGKAVERSYDGTWRWWYTPQ